MRRLLLVLALAGLALAALVLPAAAQTAPPPTIDDFFPQCRNLNDASDVVVRGTASGRFVRVTLHDPGGAQIGKPVDMAVSSGRYGGSPFVIDPTQVGSYEVRVVASGGTVSGFIEVPCQAPTLEYDPACFTASTTTVRMIGRHFWPFDRGYFDYDVQGSEAQSIGRLRIDGRGTFVHTFTVKPTRAAGYPGQANDLRDNVARATWRPCPPGTTTTAPTTTTTPPDDDTPSTTAATTTTRPPDLPGMPVTVPPSIDVPPQTVGATLTVTPELGPAGFVTGATGTGFPPGAVELHWQPGIGRTLAIAGPDGSFNARVLVFPNDRLGPRALIASAAGGAGGAPVSAFAAFLVVPSTVEPSGQNVNQINRIRRFNQR